MIEVKIVLDSVNPSGSRLTTWLLTFPRFLLPEFATHRVFSKNAASSRAIPSEKLIESVRENPAMFEQIGKANKGMQAQEICDNEETRAFNQAWVDASNNARAFVKWWSPVVAKQVVNRILEPWMHITILATCTDHRNFFKLRAHPAAQPEFQVLAYRMLDAYLNSIPSQLEWGQWHLPGVIQDGPDVENLLKMATALAARASYSAFEEGLSLDRAIAIHDKLAESGHWSPFEHCAKAIPTRHYQWSNFDNPTYNDAGKLEGISFWMQYRKQFSQENATEVNLPAILKAVPTWISL